MIDETSFSSSFLFLARISYENERLTEKKLMK